jgi:hypothetical protein
MRAPHADNDGDHDAIWRDDQRDARERNALRRDKTLLKPGWR